MDYPYYIASRASEERFGHFADLVSDSNSRMRSSKSQAVSYDFVLEDGERLLLTRAASYDLEVAHLLCHNEILAWDSSLEVQDIERYFSELPVADDDSLLLESSWV